MILVDYTLSIRKQVLSCSQTKFFVFRSFQELESHIYAHDIYVINDIFLLYLTHDETKPTSCV